MYKNTSQSGILGMMGDQLAFKRVRIVRYRVSMFFQTYQVNPMASLAIDWASSSVSP
jgi:hypothetical protein